MINYKKILLISWVFFLVSPTVTFSEDSAKKYILDNGMTVIIKPMPSSPSVALDLVVKTGSASEGKYLGTGISHFIEHMLFKGTQKRKVGEVAQEARALGGIINASTSFDSTKYTLELPKNAFSEGLDLLADMVMNSVFDPPEVEREREVIIGEMRLYRDNPERRLSELTFRTVYRQHSYRHPIIGYEPLFNALTREHLWDYYQACYIPNNIVFVVAGNLDAGKALAEIKNIFKDFKSRPYPLRNLPTEPDQLHPREAREYYSTELTRVSLAYPSTSVFDRDMFAMDVLAMILGKGESSRLYQKLFRDKQLVYSIGAENFTPLDAGLFEIRFDLEEEHLNQALKEIKSAINEIKTKEISTSELKKAKRQVLSGYIFDNQAAADIAGTMAINEAFVDDYDFYSKYIQAINEVSASDIRRVANKYLDENVLNTTAVYPQKNESSAVGSHPGAQESEIKKYILDNGLTILLKEDHTFPIVTVRLLMEGGLRAETEATSGISNLLTELWTKGTTSKTANEISKTVEELGMGLGTFAGKNSFGLSADCLSEDRTVAIDLIEDLIKNPTFPEDELLKEKEQVKSAILSRDDDIARVASKNLMETLFLKHPYRLDPLGSLQSVQNLQRKDIVSLYQSLSSPNNMVLTVFGDFKEDEVFKSLKNKFSNLTSKEIALKTDPEPPITERREKIIPMTKEQAVAMVGFQGVGVESPDRHGLEVLSSVLGSSLSGRIFVKIRDVFGQSYRLGGSFTPGRGLGTIYFYVATTPGQIDKVKELLLNEISQIQNEEITDEELAGTKAYLKGTNAMSLETIASLAMTCGLDELYGLGFDFYKQYDKNIDQVSKADVKNLAQKYLNLGKAAIVIVIPDAKR